MSRNITNGATVIEFAISRATGEKGSRAVREVAVSDQVLHGRYYFQGAAAVTNGT